MRRQFKKIDSFWKRDPIISSVYFRLSLTPANAFLFSNTNLFHSPYSNSPLHSFNCIHIFLKNYALLLLPQISVDKLSPKQL